MNRLKVNRFLVAAALSLASAESAIAADAPWQGDSLPKPALPAVSRDAQHALICQTVADWAAYQVTQLIRDDARQNQAISPEGIQILREIRLTEGLASAAFDTLAPQADHDSMYRDAVTKMRAYLDEDRGRADANTKRLVPVCQRTYARMAASGKLTGEQVQLAEDASRESVASVTEELRRPTLR